MIMKKFLIILFVIVPFWLHAQDDLMNILENETAKTHDYALGVFKGNKIINAQSTEQPGAKTIQFVVSHRFGRISGSYKEFFGLDNSTIRIGAEYGILDNLSIGFGRSSFEKTWDGYVKGRFIRQQKGKWNIPITIAGFASMAIRSDDWAEPGRHNFFSSRMFYSFQLIFSRKFGKWVSLELMPTLIHRNLVPTVKDKNDVFALGGAGSVRISNRVRFNIEYFYVIPGQIVSQYNGEPVRNNLSVGIDIETGGHVFQIHLTNSRGMIEKSFVTETTGNWFPKKFSDFGVQLGFNISRGFPLTKAMKNKEKKTAKEISKDKK
jgi:hypothetical protein